MHWVLFEKENPTQEEFTKSQGEMIPLVGQEELKGGQDHEVWR